MQQTLEQFLKALRAADVRVSPAEAIDAHRAADLTGYADRELFRDALCATLAKTADEVRRFERCFDTFFDRQEFKGLADAADAGEAPPQLAEDSPLARMLLENDLAGLVQIGLRLLQAPQHGHELGRGQLVAELGGETGGEGLGQGQGGVELARRAVLLDRLPGLLGVEVRLGRLGNGHVSPTSWPGPHGRQHHGPEITWAHCTRQLGPRPDVASHGGAR